jgi:hypothetical protein
MKAFFSNLVSFFVYLVLVSVGAVVGAAMVVAHPEAFDRVVEKAVPGWHKKKVYVLEDRWGVLPEGFNVDAKKVVADLVDHKVYVGDKYWKVSREVKVVEIINSRLVYDDKVNVYVQFEDYHWGGVLNRDFNGGSGEKVSGMVRVEYDAVVRKSDGKRLWYVTNVGNLTLKQEKANFNLPLKPKKVDFQIPGEVLPPPKVE